MRRWRKRRRKRTREHEADGSFLLLNVCEEIKNKYIIKVFLGTQKAPGGKEMEAKEKKDTVVTSDLWAYTNRTITITAC